MIKTPYLKERGYFFDSSTAALKSDTMSAQTKAGSEQSGLAGHHSLCFLDCRMPLGSRMSRTSLTPRLQYKQTHVFTIIFKWYLKNIFSCFIMSSYSSSAKRLSATRNLSRTSFIDWNGKSRQNLETKRGSQQMRLCAWHCRHKCVLWLNTQGWVFP